MSGKGGQSSGTAVSIINAEGAIVNSGYCSGRNDLDIPQQYSALGGCKGTVRSRNAQSKNIELTRKTCNLGASSGKSGNKEGTVDDKDNTGSSQGAPVSPTRPGCLVSGTRRSFNAGSDGSDVSGTRVPSNAGERIPGSKSSFYNPKKTRDGVDIKAAYNNQAPAVDGGTVIGTRWSYNVEDRHSEIKWSGAKIYSGAFAGQRFITGNRSESCNGTDQSFNAHSYGKVIVRRGKLNTGAFSCCPR